MRLTRPNEEETRYMVDQELLACDGESCGGDAVERLAAFENFYENLLKRQEATLNEMARLRAENKTKTVTFRQLMASKLENMQVLNFLKSFGIE